MKRVIASLLVILTIMCLLPRQPVEALTITGLSVTLTCSGGDYTNFNYTFDRDNTGLGKEAYQVIVTDSASNVVHLTSNSVTLGGPFSEGGAHFDYNLGTAVPGAVTYEWISQAGNGLDEQVAFSYTGFCGDGSTPTPSPSPTPSPTPTLTPTPGPSPTPTPGPTTTPNYVLRSTLVIGGQSYDVAINMEVTPADYVMVGFLVVITGLLMMLIFLYMKRGQQ